MPPSITFVPTLPTFRPNSDSSQETMEMSIESENRSGRFSRSSKLNERVSASSLSRQQTSWIHKNELPESLPPYSHKFAYTFVNGEWTLTIPGYDSPEDFLNSAPSNSQIADTSPYKNPKQEAVALLKEAQEKILRDFQTMLAQISHSKGTSRFLWKLTFLMRMLQFHERFIKAERNINQAFYMELGKTFPPGKENRWIHAHPSGPTNLAERQKNWAHKLLNDAHAKVSDALNKTNKDFLHGPFAAQIQAARAILLYGPTSETPPALTRSVAPQPAVPPTPVLPTSTPTKVQTPEVLLKMFDPEPWTDLPPYPTPFTEHEYSRTDKNSLKREFNRCGYRSGEDFLASEIGDSAKTCGRQNPAQEAADLFRRAINPIENFIDERFEYHQKKARETRNPTEQQYWVDHFRTEMEQNMARWQERIPEMVRAILQSYIKEFIKAGEGSGWCRWLPKPPGISSRTTPIREVTIKIPVIENFTIRGLKMEITSHAPNWRYSGDKRRWEREWKERDDPNTSPHGRRQEAIEKVYASLQKSAAAGSARLKEKIADRIRQLQEAAIASA